MFEQLLTRHAFCQPVADFFRAELALYKDRPPGAVPGGQILLKVLIAKGEMMTATVFRFSRPENPEA